MRWRAALIALTIGLCGCARTPADEANVLFVKNVFDQMQPNLPYQSEQPQPSEPGER